MNDHYAPRKNDTKLLAEATKHMTKVVEALRLLEFTPQGPPSEMARIPERSSEVSSMAAVILGSLESMKEDLAERTVQYQRGCTWQEAIFIRQGVPMPEHTQPGPTANR